MCLIIWIGEGESPRVDTTFTKGTGKGQERVGFARRISVLVDCEKTRILGNRDFPPPHTKFTSKTSFFSISQRKPSHVSFEACNIKYPLIYGVLACFSLIHTPGTEPMSFFSLTRGLTPLLLIFTAIHPLSIR